MYHQSTWLVSILILVHLLYKCSNFFKGNGRLHISKNSDDKFKLHFPQGGTLKYKQMCLSTWFHQYKIYLFPLDIPFFKTFIYLLDQKKQLKSWTTWTYVFQFETSKTQLFSTSYSTFMQLNCVKKSFENKLPPIIIATINRMMIFSPSPSRVSLPPWIIHNCCC